MCVCVCVCVCVFQASSFQLNKQRLAQFIYTIFHQYLYAGISERLLRVNGEG